MPPAVASRRYTTAIFPATPSDKRALDLADRAPTALPSTLLACCPCGESLNSISTQHDVVERGLTKDQCVRYEQPVLILARDNKAKSCAARGRGHATTRSRWAWIDR